MVSAIAQRRRVNRKAGQGLKKIILVGFAMMEAILAVAGNAVFSVSEARAGDAAIQKINTLEWIKPEHKGIWGHLEVQQQVPRLLTFQYTFDTPLDPVSGIDPTALFIFNSCVSSRLSMRKGYVRWYFGSYDENLQFRDIHELKLFIAMVNDEESLPPVIEGEDVKWSDEMQVNEWFDLCEKLLRPQYMWKKAGENAALSFLISQFEQTRPH